MQRALLQAKIAFELGEIPVGAVLVSNNQIIAQAHNQTEKLQDVSAHAEILCLTSGSNYLNSKYLNQCTLYVTLEPCVMCAGALAWAQLGTLVYAAPDTARGFSRLGKGNILHKRTKVVKDVLAQESTDLLHSFFKKLRK
ncbi:MAG: nucleoside deaminase [Bernardetiaceae bacterium]|nr:nucleoside deaminase [Bernardetiaceae bacterium]